MKRVDLCGQTFGRLTVDEMVYVVGKDSQALCSCRCGCKVVALAYNLKNGNTQSCGCLAREGRSARGRLLGQIQGKKNRTHGMSKTPTYVSWLDARKRCFSQQNKRYPQYGGRGISMCHSWAKSFDAFLSDMGTKPEGMTLERVDVDGDYTKDNCTWATKAQQSQNTRRTKASWPTVREMRARHAKGETSSSLARHFGMSWSNAKMIVSGATWRE